MDRERYLRQQDVEGLGVERLQSMHISVVGAGAVARVPKGYVVAAPGARGRTNQDGAGKYVGKAPAAIVDLKAAVRTGALTLSVGEPSVTVTLKPAEA